MENIDILKIIKDKNKNEIINIISKYGKYKALSLFAQFLDKRAYITIDFLGNIKRKKANLILPIFAYCNDIDYLANYLIEHCDLKEKQNFNSINRFSNLSIEELKKNLMKTLFNGNLDFSKKFAKELFFRDKDAFYTLIANFSCIGNSRSFKPLLVLAFKKLIDENEYDENIFYLLLSYLTKYRDDTYFYELSLKSPNKIDTIVLTNNLANKTTLKLLDDFEIHNKNSVLKKLLLEEKLNSYDILPEEEYLIKYFQ